jgi:hypothetical protein
MAAIVSMLKHHGFVALPNHEQEGHWLTVALTPQVNLGAKPTLPEKTII